MSDCLFCKIVNQEIPAKIVYEDDQVLAFDDIDPQAPVHKLIVPKQHIATLNDVGAEQGDLIGYMLQAAKHLARKHDIADDGYRVLMNCNAKGGQTVFHIHMHLLGGRAMSWPPG